MKVPFTAFTRRHAAPDAALTRMRALVTRGEVTLGRAVADFESAFAASLDVPYAVGVGSGTEALSLALKALGIGVGREVLLCANSFVSTAAAVHTSCARIVFCDCNERGVMDPAAAEAAVGPHTAALLPAHFGGQPADLAALRDLAARKRLHLLEDVGAAYGAAADGLACGTVGVMAAFSLHPHKDLEVWGDGGLITTASEGLYRKLLLMRNQGRLDRDTYAFFAFNSRLDALYAAQAHAQLDDIPALQARRRAIAAQYDAAFAPLAPDLALPPRDTRDRHVFHLYSVRTPRRDALCEALAADGIEARVHHSRPLHLQPAAAPLGYRPGAFPMTELLAREALSLPCHPFLSEAEVAHVIARVRAFYEAP